MKHGNRYFFGAVIALAATIGLGLLAAPARAECKNDCIVPILASGPNSVMKRSWAVEELARFLKRDLRIEYKDSVGKPIKVVPQYEVWTSKSGKPVAVRQGKALAIKEPRRYEIVNGIFDSLPRDLQRFLPGDKFTVSSVRTVERAEIAAPSWSTATTAVALLVRPATKAAGQSASDDQMLVLFIVGHNGFGP